MTPEALRRKVFYIDGLRYSFAMADVSARRLQEALDSIARRQAASDYSEHDVAAALLDAWTLVDMCHRVRELIQQTPGLSKREPAVQVFLRTTSQVEDLRHYVQHFRSGIATLPQPSTPLWGSLSWVSTDDETACYTIVTGNVVTGVAASTCSYDTHHHGFANRMMLFAEKDAVDLISLSEKLKDLKAFLLEWIDKQPSFKRAEGKTPILKFQVRAQ